MNSPTFCNFLQPECYSDVADISRLLDRNLTVTAYHTVVHYIHRIPYSFLISSDSSQVAYLYWDINTEYLHTWPAAHLIATMYLFHYLRKIGYSFVTFVTLNRSQNSWINLYPPENIFINALIFENMHCPSPCNQLYGNINNVWAVNKNSKK